MKKYNKVNWLEKLLDWFFKTPLDEPFQQVMDMIHDEHKRNEDRAKGISS